jgi:hypothetical protein
MKKLLLAAIGVLLVGTATSDSLARTVTPLNGRPWDSLTAGAFSSSWNRLYNNCLQGNGTPKWLFDAPIDNGNNYHAVYFYGRGLGILGSVQCWAVGTTNDGASGYSASQTRSDATWGAMSGTTSVWVPSWGNLHADCNLPCNTGTGGGVSSLAYDQ